MPVYFVDSQPAWKKLLYPARERIMEFLRKGGIVLTAMPGLRTVLLEISKRLFRREIRRLHDVLEQTPIAGRYWVWAGMLLGWAREGRTLAHDTSDADFAFLAEDFELMCQSIPALTAAGFRLVYNYRNNDGEVTQFVFKRSGIQFDFLKLTPVGDRFHYYGYWDDVQLSFAIPAQPREPFDFLGRRWLKAKDHDKDLTALYGNWRVPDKNWDTGRDSPAITARDHYLPPPSELTDFSEHLQPARG